MSDKNCQLVGKGAEGSKEISFSAYSEHWNPIYCWPLEPKKAALSSCWSERLQLISMTWLSHSSGTSGSGSAWSSSPPVLFPKAWPWVGLFQRAENVIESLFQKSFFLVGGHSLVIAAPGFLLFLLLLSSLSGVLVNQLGVGGSDLRQFPWCKYSPFDYQPDVTEYGVGKTQDLCVTAFHVPALPDNLLSNWHSLQRWKVAQD